MNNKSKKRDRRDYTRSSLIKVKQYTRTRDGKVQIIEQTFRGLSKQIICKECKKIFIVKGNRINRKFCSRNCYEKDWIKRIAGWNRGSRGLQIAWNKNLTKETDERVRRYSESESRVIKEQFRSGKRKVNGYRHYKETDIENILANQLDLENIRYKRNFPIVLKYFTTYPDLYIEESKLCIYADGEHWHNYPNLTQRDKQVNSELKKADYTVLRFWGKEIRKNLPNCIKKIKEMI